MARATTARRGLLTSVGVEASRAVRAPPSTSRSSVSTSGTSRHRRPITRGDVDHATPGRGVARPRHLRGPDPASDRQGTPIPGSHGRAPPRTLQGGCHRQRNGKHHHGAIDREAEAPRSRPHLPPQRATATSISPCRASTSSCDAICPVAADTICIRPNKTPHFAGLLSGRPDLNRGPHRPELWAKSRGVVRSTCKSTGSHIASAPARPTDIAVDYRGFGREMDPLPKPCGCH